MRVSRGIGTTALVLLFGMTAGAYTQQDHQKEDRGKPEKQQGKQEGEKGARGQRQQAGPQRGQPAQQPQQERAHEPQQQEQRQQPRQRPQQQQQQAQRVRQQPERTQQQAVAWQQQQGWVQRGGWRGHTSFQQNRAQHWASEHRTWAQRGGYGGFYIPQYSFSDSFGRQHLFRMQYRPTMYLGYPRFSYGGYSFLLVDPWPEYWADNWYDSDDLYIDYDDYDTGYYLHNHRYPEIRLAITVAL